jgi:FxsC-like protein
MASAWEGRVTDDNNSASPDNGPYFFLSYAHTPRQEGSPGDPDIWVANLFQDLCAHIMQLTSLPPGAISGFMDRELRTGSDWPTRLARALATCRVFVPLYSRRYFDSEHCGKEWFAFSRRALNHVARAGPAEAIIPALWVPVAPALLPEAAKSIQFDHSQLGERYSTHGFYGIIKLSRYRSEYEEAVYELARRIVDVGQGTHIEPESPVRYDDSLESAFGSADQPQPGRRRMRITIVAPEASALPGGRADYHYGRSARDWNPYRPESVRSLADHAADLVRSLGYQPDVGDLDEHLDALLGTEQPSGPCVLLVDAWATMQPECRERLRRIDDRREPWVQIVLPWNRKDTEIITAEPALRQSLESALKQKLAAGRVDSRIAVSGVPSLGDFSMVLPMVVRVAARQFLRHAQAYPPEGPVIQKPRLTGPAADPPNPEH